MPVKRASHVRVKICGITRPEDARCAAEAGADAIGLVFYAPSSRYVDDLVKAKEIVDASGPFVTTVGLFVDADPAEVEKILSHVPLQMLQFHGSEDEADCRKYRRPFIKALRMKEGLDMKVTMAEYPSASGFLLDTYVEGEPGGTGQTFDWQRFPRESERSLILAGGLTPQNVAEAIKMSRPYGLDVSGGVESSPGVKSEELIRAFVEKAKYGSNQ